MIIRIAVVLIFVIPIVLIWVSEIDKAVNNDAWKKQDAKDRQEEDKAQEEYLKRYTQKKQEKRERKERKKCHQKMQRK